MRKTMFRWLIALAILLPCLVISASAATILGENYHYSLSSRGEATIVSAVGEASKGAVTIPSTLDGYPVTAIKNGAFFGYSFVTSVTIPDSVTHIGENAFRGCTRLTSVTIGNGVTYIGDYAFDGCASLTSVTIPDSVTYIGVYAFKGCSGLTSVTIGNGVTYIGDYAFDGCASLTSVTIPDSVANIEGGAFRNCTGLTNATIGDGVTSIDAGAFKGCSGLTSVTIGDGVTSIGREAFSGCKGLTSVYYTGDIAGWCAIDQGTGELKYHAEELYIGGELVSGELAIPDGVTSIGDWAFYGCASLTSVTIPDSVTSIGASAFANCDSLTGVTLPDSVTSIGNDAFGGCTGLTSVTIGSGVTSIGDYAFYNCTSLTNVTYMGDEAGWNSISIGTGNTPLTNATRHYLPVQSVGEVSNGTVTLSAEFGEVGDTIVVTAIADAGYRLKTICVDGAAIEGNTYTIAGNHMVTAVFEKIVVATPVLGTLQPKTVKTITINGQEYQLCRWYWTPKET